MQIGEESLSDLHFTFNILHLYAQFRSIVLFGAATKINGSIIPDI